MWEHWVPKILSRGRASAWKAGGEQVELMPTGWKWREAYVLWFSIAFFYRAFSASRQWAALDDNTAGVCPNRQEPLTRGEISGTFFMAWMQ